MCALALGRLILRQSDRASYAQVLKALLAQRKLLEVVELHELSRRFDGQFDTDRDESPELHALRDLFLFEPHQPADCTAQPHSADLQVVFCASCRKVILRSTCSSPPLLWDSRFHNVLKSSSPLNAERPSRTRPFVQALQTAYSRLMLELARTKRERDVLHMARVRWVLGRVLSL